MMTDEEARALIRRRLERTLLIEAVGKFSEAQARVSYEEFYGEGGVLAEVVKHAVARKLMGAFRYEQKIAGLSYDQRARIGSELTYIERGIDKLKLYQATGNKEYLVDAFNYCLLEWARPYHPNAHFESTERKEEA